MEKIKNWKTFLCIQQTRSTYYIPGEELGWGQKEKFTVK